MIPGTVTSNDILLLAEDPSPPLDNESVQLLYLCVAVTLALMTFRPDLRYIILFVHVHLVVFLAKAFILGLSMPWNLFMKLTLGYYAAMLGLMEQTRQNQHQRHRILLMQVE